MTSDRPHLSVTLNALAVGGIAAVLVAAYGFQFALGELPCPLCTLQRVAFVLAMFGFILNATFGIRPLHYAVILLSAAFGMAASGRQVLLHIVPGSGDYGPPFLGLHFYTWAFILFAAMVPGTAALLSFGGDTHPPVRRAWITAVCGLGTGLTLLNALTTFLQCGPIECIDDPVRWWIGAVSR